MGLVLMGRAMLNKSLIQFSVDGCGCVPSLLFELRPNYGGGKEDNGDPLQNVQGTHFCIQCPQPCSRPPPTHASTRLLDIHGQVWVILLWGYYSFFLGPGAHKVLFVPSKSVFPQFCGSSVIKTHLPSKSNSLGVLSPFSGSPGWRICCGH